MAKKANGKIREIRDGQVILEMPLPVAVIELECKKIAGMKNSKNPLRTR